MEHELDMSCQVRALVTWLICSREGRCKAPGLGTLVWGCRQMKLQALQPRPTVVWSVAGFAADVGPPHRHSHHVLGYSGSPLFVVVTV